MLRFLATTEITKRKRSEESSYNRGKVVCQSVISGSLTLRDTKIRNFGVKF